MTSHKLFDKRRVDALGLHGRFPHGVAQALNIVRRIFADGEDAHQLFGVDRIVLSRKRPLHAASVGAGASGGLSACGGCVSKPP